MLVPTKERLRPMNQTQQTDGVSELEIKVHNYLKYLIVEKDLSFEKDDYDERIDEEGSMRVMNSMNDKNPKYYWDCVKELTALLTQQAVELERKLVDDVLDYDHWPNDKGKKFARLFLKSMIELSRSEALSQKGEE